jgi:hypothetical protein
MIPGSLNANSPSKEQKAMGGPYSQSIATWSNRVLDSTGGMGLRGSLSPNQTVSRYYQSSPLSPGAPVSSKADSVS